MLIEIILFILSAGYGIIHISEGFSSILLIILGFIILLTNKRVKDYLSKEDYNYSINWKKFIDWFKKNKDAIQTITQVLNLIVFIYAGVFLTIQFSPKPQMVTILGTFECPEEIDDHGAYVSVGIANVGDKQGSFNIEFKGDGVYYKENDELIDDWHFGLMLMAGQDYQSQSVVPKLYALNERTSFVLRLYSDNIIVKNMECSYVDGKLVEN